jgi:hypothetical protein
MGSYNEMSIDNNKPKKMTLREIEKLLGHKIQIVDKKIVKVEDVPVGDVFLFCGIEFVVLNNTGDGVEVITRKIHGESVFDSASNKYVNSMASSRCSIFHQEMKNHPEYKKEAAVSNPIKPFSMDLTTLDGRNYGSHRNCYAELLTIYKYRQFVKILDKHKADKSWMLATALSTKDNGSESVCFLDDKTNTINFMHLGCTCGIRPYMILRGDVVVEALDD